MNKEVEPTDQRITHLERLPKKKWNEKYLARKEVERMGRKTLALHTNTGAGYDEEP